MKQTNKQTPYVLLIGFFLVENERLAFHNDVTVIAFAIVSVFLQYLIVARYFSQSFGPKWLLPHEKPGQIHLPGWKT